MKKMLHLLMGFMLLTIIAKSQTTYYWVGGNGGSIATAATAIDWISTNWNTNPAGTGSARTISAGNDILIFDGNSPKLISGNKSIYIRNVPKDSCGQLQFINGANVSIQSVVATNVAITGYTTTASTTMMLSTLNYSVVQGLPVVGTGIPTGTTITTAGAFISVATTGGTTTTGSAIVTVSAGSTSIVPGLTVSGTGIPTNATVLTASTPTVATATGATSTSTAITLTAANAAIVVGMGVTGSGVPAGATVTAYDGNVTVTISAATTTTVATTTLTFASAQTITISATATATGSLITITFVGQAIILSQAATATTAVGTPTTVTLNTDAGSGGTAGTFALGTAYGGATLPVTGTGANFTSFFKQGDFIMTGNNYATMCEVLSVTSDNDMTIANEAVTALTAGAYYKAIPLYIKGNPGLMIDATSTFGVGNSNSGSGNVNGFVISLLSGATGTIYGNFSFLSRGNGARLVAANPGSLVFKNGSSCNIGISGSKIYPLGAALGTGSASAATFTFNTTNPGITFEAGANYRHNSVIANTPFGVGTIAATPLIYAPAVTFQPNSNYYFLYVNGYPPYFYSCNSTNYSPASAATFGNVIFGGTTIPSKSSTVSLFFLPARVDTLTLTTTYASASTNYINNTVAPPMYVYGTIINNSPAALNFGKVMFAGQNTVVGAGTTAPSFTNLLVADGTTLMLNANISVTGSVTPIGKLDLGVYNINEGTTGLFATAATTNVTYAKPTGSNSASGGCSATLASNSIFIRAVTNIPVGAIVTSTSHPTLFAAGTTVLNYNGSSTYFLSKAATASADSASTTPLSLTFTVSGATIATANPAGLDGSIQFPASVTLNAGSNFIFNAATTTPFPATVSSPITAGSVSFASAATSNKHILNVTGSLVLGTGNLTVNTGDSIIVKAGNSVTGSATGFVDTKVDNATGAKGVLGIEGFSAQRTFPVGTNGNYLPVTITPDTLSNVYVTSFNGATVDGTPNGTALGATRLDTSVNAVYFVNRTSPATARTYKLIVGYPAALKGTTFATYTNQIGLSNYTGAVWSAARGAGNNTTNIAADSVNVSGTFYVTHNASPSTILPVKFSTVSANSIGGNAVKVGWNIYQEINIDQYIVERSVNGIVFISVGAVTANGSSVYSLVDNNVPGSVVYYRIKSVDKGTGAVGYSSVVSVTLTGSAVPSVNVYPNPVVGSQIYLQTANFKVGKLYVTLYDNQGKQIGVEMVNYSGGSLSQTLSISPSVKAGTYQLVVTDGVSTINTSIFIVI